MLKEDEAKLKSLVEGASADTVAGVVTVAVCRRKITKTAHLKYLVAECGVPLTQLTVRGVCIRWSDDDEVMETLKWVWSEYPSLLTDGVVVVRAVVKRVLDKGLSLQCSDEGIGSGDNAKTSDYLRPLLLLPCAGAKFPLEFVWGEVFDAIQLALQCYDGVCDTFAETLARRLCENDCDAVAFLRMHLSPADRLVFDDRVRRMMVQEENEWACNVVARKRHHCLSDQRVSRSERATSVFANLKANGLME